MTDDPLTCERVDALDLDVQYTLGKLSPEVAERFEEHFFGCERCFALVQGGIAARRAVASDQTAASAGRVPGRRIGPVWGMLVAAALVLLALGVRRWVATDARPIEADTLRGAGTGWLASARIAGDTVVASWPAVPEAERYLVRIYGAAGELLLERPTSDTTFRSTLPASGTRLTLDVQAQDSIRQMLARAPLVRLDR